MFKGGPVIHSPQRRTPRIGISQRPMWQITVLSVDSHTIIFHAKCEDWREIQCLAPRRGR
jgi:hypothetical protein